MKKVPLSWFHEASTKGPNTQRKGSGFGFRVWGSATGPEHPGSQKVQNNESQGISGTSIATSRPMRRKEGEVASLTRVLLFLL